MSPKKQLFLWLMMALLVVAFTGCAQQPDKTKPDSAWQPADLRLLKLDETVDANHQIIAAYARLTATDLELRVDFLGSPDPFDYDLYVLVDDRPGGGGQLPLDTSTDMAWDLALGFPGQGLPRAFGPDGAPADVRPRIIRMALLDAAVVRISRRVLAGDPHDASFQILVTRAGETALGDSVGPLNVDGPAPTGQANMLLLFWDGLPAATPAQALRRWNGAHTGPYGQRHGLGVLLDAAASTGVPLFVLDLKRPDRLSALDAMDQMQTVRQYNLDGLLILPDLISGKNLPPGDSLIEKMYKLPPSRLLYGAVSGSTLPGKHTAAFYQPTGSWQIDESPAIPNAASIAHPLLEQDGTRWIPLPDPATEALEQANPDGLTNPVRRALLQLALSGQTGQIAVLGGSLPHSTWGDSTTASPALRYIAGHPWLRVLGESDLLQHPAQPGEPPCADGLCLPDLAPESPNNQIRAALEQSPPGLFTDLAWQAYQGLSEPTNDLARSALQAGYLGNIGPLLAAARWSANPGEQAGCTEDLDWDGTAECVLASEQSFLVLSAADGRLMFAAGRTAKGAPFQYIGPRSQFAVGLGEPSEWRLGQGRAADPQELAGAFSDTAGTFGSGVSAFGAGDALPGGPDSQAADGQNYQVSIQPGEAIFSHPAGQVRKIYRLVGSTLQVSIEINNQAAPNLPIKTTLPLALLGEHAFEPGFFRHYLSGGLSSTIRWRVDDGPGIEITAQNATLNASYFNESQSILTEPEDANIAYPPGHFLPFPLAMVTVESEGSFQLIFIPIDER